VDTGPGAIDHRRVKLAWIAAAAGCASGPSYDAVGDALRQLGMVTVLDPPAKGPCIDRGTYALDGTPANIAVTLADCEYGYARLDASGTLTAVTTRSSSGDPSFATSTRNTSITGSLVLEEDGKPWTCDVVVTINERVVYETGQLAGYGCDASGTIGGKRTDAGCL
jgi:hypothetical protein